MKDEMNTDELAGLFGVSAQTIREMTRRHVLAKAGTQYPTAESIRRGMAHLREGASARGGKAATGVANERRALLKAQRQRVEFSLAKERGEFISAEDARADLAQLIRFVRSSLLALPSRLAGRFPHLTPEEVVHVDDEIRSIMTEMAHGQHPGGARRKVVR
jgi:phage terminase Nu1 subunit (DNA packaging protein)